MKKFLALAFLFVMPTGQMAEENIAQKNIKHNGTSWLEFGQAVIDCAQSARCFLYRDEHEGIDEEVTIVNQEDLSLIKAFVKEKFIKKFNFSPTAPIAQSIRWENDITFYSIRLKPDDELPHYDKVLVSIPISDLIAGDQYDSIIKEYHELIRSITNRPTGKRWWLILATTSSLAIASLIFFFIRRKMKA